MCTQGGRGGGRLGVGKGPNLLWEKYACYAWVVWWRDLWATALLLSWHWTWVRDKGVWGEGGAPSWNIGRACLCMCAENTHRLTISHSKRPPGRPHFLATLLYLNCQHLAWAGTSLYLWTLICALLGKQHQAWTRRAISLSRCPPVLRRGEKGRGLRQRKRLGWKEKKT